MKRELKHIVEALIFASDEPIDTQTIVNIIKSVDKEEELELYSLVENAIEELNQFYEQNGVAFRIIKIAKGYQFATRPEFSRYVGFMNTERRQKRLSQAALETLAIIAYKQPITKPEIERIRGVNADYILSTLLEKNLICIKGRAETVGRPLLYGTTDEFLKYFGISDISDLPKPREIEEILSDEAFLEQKKRLLMNLIEEDQPELDFGEGENNNGDQGGNNGKDEIE
ncbi:MAG: SMC-Scp complex subunit ScpB [Ignavibacteria bacterium]|jgi:segregation and condensation protein B|nr:SMC-Scp complex subunit ScpB [Ignavibacteria bacterium]MDH7528190.1 SMC-Scp complex subunit ScpB [Ignavibacteria bacterium]NPV10399.1 SMC-Scp complex subunit ScpB [Ignavibacteria bacterium]